MIEIEQDGRHASARSSALRRLNEFFDRIFVLTIDRNEERRRLFEAAHPDLDFEYVYGVDGSRESGTALNAAYDDAGAQRLFGRSLSPGQIGCALTHRMAYGDVIRNGYRNALLLEDDAVLHLPAAGSVTSVLDQLPSDWDLLYLYSQRGGESRYLDLKVKCVYPVLHTFGIRRYDMNAIRSGHSHPYSRNLRTAGRRWGAVAYGITAATAGTLLSMQTPIADVADGAPRRFSSQPETRAFLASPQLFLFQSGVHSTIWNRPPRKR